MYTDYFLIQNREIKHKQKKFKLKHIQNPHPNPTEIYANRKKRPWYWATGADNDLWL